MTDWVRETTAWKISKTSHINISHEATERIFRKHFQNKSFHLFAFSQDLFIFYMSYYFWIVWEMILFCLTSLHNV